MGGFHEGNWLSLRFEHRRQIRMKPAIHHIALTGLALLFAASGCREATTQKPAIAPATAAQTVQLTIDYGDGGQKGLPAIAWREGMTVLDALESAKANQHGITFTKRGSGEATLITKIDDVANQEDAEGAKNWLFYINDRLADKSCGVATVKPGDSILWKFQTKE
jgi:Domain of unknown function (DUF4430)